MRIIAGTARGIRLGPVPTGTRPASDRAREGLFASLGALVADARVLDLFAGTGAMGIEALSRGASHATFVDRSRHATEAVRDNLARAHLGDLAAIHTADAASYVRERSRDQPAFDLVLVDPPYEMASEELAGLLGSLDTGWLAPGGTFVVTRGHKAPLPAAPLHWEPRRRLRYGDSLLICYREVGWA